MPPKSGPIQAGSFGGFECSSELKEDVPFLNQVLTPSWNLLLDSSKSVQPQNDVQAIPRSLLLPQCILGIHKQLVCADMGHVWVGPGH